MFIVAGYVPVGEAINIILGALGLSGLRHGLAQFVNDFVAQETPGQQ